MDQSCSRWRRARFHVRRWRKDVVWRLWCCVFLILGALSVVLTVVLLPFVMLFSFALGGVFGVVMLLNIWKIGKPLDMQQLAFLEDLGATVEAFMERWPRA